MGKRKGRKSETVETLQDCEPENERSNELEDVEKAGFFACYLLTSLCPRYKGHTYIGFTVDPRRRIRQHNGELCSGAWRTKKKRPWEMVLCIYGFPTNVAALQFEWAWQHPVESLAVRKAAVTFKSLGGLANKIKLAYTMLTLPAWQNLNLTVNFFSTKYTKHYAGCPTLPNHMKVQIRSMDELPCYTEGGQNIFEFQNGLWDDDAELDRTFGSYESEERLEDITMTVLDSADDGNIEETIPYWNREKDEQSSASNSPQKPLPSSFSSSSEQALPSSSSNSLEWELPSCFNTFPERALPSFCSVLSPIIDVEDCSKESLPTIAADKDEPRTKNSASSCEVEVIDVFTPSPEYRINSRRKKQSVSTLSPQIIDLTQSPIFV